ncbi:MAG: ABC transporter ATP-binding protein [Actinomycetia bacterium]|nr:ABC transporter ATP-binding protein [Actinomycetes bacterium]
MTAMAIPETTTTSTPAHLRLSNLSKTYPGQSAPAVDQVGLEVPQGKLIALLGPSGCGKTTTLRMIAGLIEPSTGAIEVDDHDLTRSPVHKRGMGMVFQSYALFPHLNVRRNVAFGLEMRKVNKPERAAKVRAALDMVQLGHLADRRVKELSGGQQQRVALARALVVEPSVLLLDEPLSNLDAKLREAMRDEIRAIVHRVDVTTVFVTHDQDEALSMADEIVVMNEGRVEQVGTPEDIYEQPATRFVADFIGRANLLPARVVDSDPAAVVVEVAGRGAMRATPSTDTPAVGADVTVLVRPHRLGIAQPTGDPASDTLRGTVSAHSYTGEILAHTITVGDHLLEAETLTGFGQRYPVGSEVDLTWRTADALVLKHT